VANLHRSIIRGRYCELDEGCPRVDVDLSACIGTLLGRDCGGSGSARGQPSERLPTFPKLASRRICGLRYQDCRSGAWFAGRSNLVDALVETLQHPTNWHPKDFTDSKKGCHGDGSACLDLLPVPSRKAEGDHVLLAKAAPFAQLANSFPETGKELCLIRHPPVCKDPRAERPRAD